MTPEESRSRLGWLVAERRKALGLSKDAAARVAEVSRLTWRNVEDGKAVRDTTYAAIERALDWVPGAAEAALKGGTPQLQSDIPAATELVDASSGSVRLAIGMLELIRAEYGEAVYRAALAQVEALDGVDRTQDEGRSQRNRQSAT